MANRMIWRLLIVFCLVLGACSSAPAAQDSQDVADAHGPVGIVASEVDAQRVSPCDPNEDADRAPLAPTLERTTDWWEVVSADDAALALLEAEDGSGSLSSSPVKVEVEGLTGQTAVSGPIDEIWFGIWHAGAVRAGLENAGARVFVATDEFPVALVTMLKFEDGSAMFGGICGTDRYMRVLSAADAAETSRAINDITNHVGKDLVDSLMLGQ